MALNVFTTALISSMFGRLFYSSVVAGRMKPEDSLKGISLSDSECDALDGYQAILFVLTENMI